MIENHNAALQDETQLIRKQRNWELVSAFAAGCVSVIGVLLALRLFRSRPRFPASRYDYEGLVTEGDREIAGIGSFEIE